jgi:hemolysin activation/secretion protein
MRPVRPVRAFVAGLWFAALLCAGSGRAAESASDPAFDILEFRVEGNSVLSQRAIEHCVTPFLGPKKHFSDVESARKALEDAYQKAGFQTVFVEIPEQRVSGGVIHLKVLEGRVGLSHVTGERYFEAGEIRAAVPQLAGGSVPNFTEMQQELAQVNKSPDRQVAPILTPGRVPGTVDVNLSVKDTLPLHGEIEDDNYNSPFTTADRASAALHYDNLWQRGHSIALNYQLAPADHDETNVLYATYLWRFTGSDEVVSVYGIRSNSNVAVVGGATILGNAKIAGTRWIHPLGVEIGAAASYFESLTVGIDRKDFAQTDISAQAADITVLPPITYYPLSLSFSGTRVGPGATAQLMVGAVTAPRDLFGNTDIKFQSRRVAGHSGYVTWKVDTSIDYKFLKRWGAYLRVDGQWTADPLIPNEQYITGGAESVRGYLESEISGDRGAHATVEARLYPLGHPGLDGQRLVYACLFVDGAQVRLVEPLGPQISIESILSTGIGFHAQNWHHMRIAADLAEALRDGGHGVTGPITPKGTKRVQASIAYDF